MHHEQALYFHLHLGFVTHSKIIMVGILEKRIDFFSLLVEILSRYLPNLNVNKRFGIFYAINTNDTNLISINYGKLCGSSI